ncbi:MAG: hypothetical protein IT249_07995 [Chitinophagaceae bacterium]|nr:hypothetical protein [Chitinophagaceae bacterium]
MYITNQPLINIAGNYWLRVFKQKTDLKNFEKKLTGISKKNIDPVLNGPDSQDCHAVLELEPLSVDRAKEANTTTIKIKPADLAIVKTLHKKYFPSATFDYSFLDEFIVLLMIMLLVISREVIRAALINQW